VVKYPTRHNGYILGGWLSLMLMAKILAAPLILMPVVAVLLLNPYQTVNLRKAWRPQIRALFNLYRPAIIGAVVVVGVVWGIILAVYLGRGFFAPDETAPLVDRYLYEGVRRTTGESTEAPPSKLWIRNWWRLQEILYFLWGPILIGLAIITTPFLVKQAWRKYIYLLLAPSLIWGLVMFAAGQLTTRYLTVTGHMIVILLAGGVFSLQTALYKQFGQRWLSALPLIAVLIWGGTFSAVFFAKLTSDPTRLDLPQRDQWEYFMNQAGYGFKDALLDIAEMPSVSEGESNPRVYGMVRNCQYLESHIPPETTINIQCGPVHNVWPRRDFPNRAESYADIEKLTRKYGQIYLLIEELDEPIMNEWVVNAHFRYIKTYERPFDGVPVNLYIASPRNELNVEFIAPN
jgi:hypothetical protein